MKGRLINYVYQMINLTFESTVSPGISKTREAQLSERNIEAV